MAANHPRSRNTVGQHAGLVAGLLALALATAHAQFELTEVSDAGATPFLVTPDEWTYEDIPGVAYGFYRLKPGEPGFSCIHRDQAGPSWTGDPESPVSEAWWYLVTAHDGSVENLAGAGSEGDPRVSVASCWGEPTGACCVDQDCSEQSEGDCLALDGTYLGDGTPCGASSCTVALCHFDGMGGGELITAPIGELADHLSHGDDVPRFGGYCYIHVSSTSLLATDAEQACRLDFGGNLASIHDLAEDDFISGLVDPAGSGGITAHVGGLAPSGFCDGETGTYGWTDGTPWDYSNWRAGEPNCSSLPFGAIQFWPNTNATSGWNDVRGERFSAGYVCKFGGP